MNGVIAGVAAANGATVADAFTAFQKQAAASSGNSVTAGLVLPNDVHPSEKGQRLLADTVEAAAALISRRGWSGRRGPGGRRR